MRLALVVLLAAIPLASTAHAKACPPGLAKKDPSCVPPGQVGRAARDSDDRPVQEIDRAAEELRRTVDRSAADRDADRDAAVAKAQADLAEALGRVAAGDPAGGPVPLVRIDDLDLPGLPDGERYMVIDNTVIRVSAEQYDLLDAIRRAAAVAPID